MRWLGLILAIPVLAVSAPPSDIAGFLRSATEALSQDDAAGFLSNFSASLPEYKELRRDVETLLARYEANSVIEIISEEGNDQSRILALDWTLSLNDKEPANSPKESHRAFVKCTIKREGNQWKFVAFEPANFFKVAN